MQLKDNPYLKQEDYSAQYNENIDKLKNNPELVEFDKLCYEVFHMNEMGKQLMEAITERYLLRPSGSPGDATFPTMAIWGEGFKQAYFLLKASAKAHEQRIKAGAPK